MSSMQDYGALVGATANQYKAAMLAGDRDFVGNPLELALLRAIVAESAAGTLDFVRTRIADGDRVAKPLEDLVPALQKGDWVGNGLHGLEQSAIKQARSTVKSLVLGDSAPLWLLGVAGFFVGLFAFSYSAGDSVAWVIAPALLGGGAFFFVARTAMLARPAVVAVGTGAVSLLDSTATIGRSAETLFDQVVKPQLTSFFEAVGAPVRLPGQLNRIRAYAKALVVTSYCVIAFCAVVFVAGAGHALYVMVDAALDPPPPVCPYPHVSVGGRCF